MAVFGTTLTDLQQGKVAEMEAKNRAQEAYRNFLGSIAQLGPIREQNQIKQNELNAKVQQEMQNYGLALRKQAHDEMMGKEEASARKEEIGIKKEEIGIKKEEQKSLSGLRDAQIEDMKRKFKVDKMKVVTDLLKSISDSGRIPSGAASAMLQTLPSQISKIQIDLQEVSQERQAAQAEANRLNEAGYDEEELRREIRYAQNNKYLTIADGKVTVVPKTAEERALESSARSMLQTMNTVLSSFDRTKVPLDVGKLMSMLDSDEDNISEIVSLVQDAVSKMESGDGGTPGLGSRTPGVPGAAATQGPLLGEFNDLVGQAFAPRNYPTADVPPVLGGLGRGVPPPLPQTNTMGRPMQSGRYIRRPTGEIVPIQ